MLRIPSYIPIRTAAAAVLLCAVVGCQSGPSGSYKKKINTDLAAQNYAQAEMDVEKAKEGEYGKKNMVLFYLDKGTVLHHAGKYAESDSAFDQAEQRMVELYTKSITKAAGMLVLNDGTADYAGEPFERAMTNVYRAFNWLFQGKLDEALVEARKAGIFLDELNRTLEGKAKYKDDAFAQYLAALLYADAGKMDDARISMDRAMDAYGWYQSSYGSAKPHFEFPKEDKKAQRGELVFVHFNGAAPIKVSKTFQVAWGNAVAIAKENDTEAQGAQFSNGLRAGITGNSITVSYPEYVAQPFRTKGSEVSVDGGEALPATLMEDIQAIATKTLQDRMAIIRTRAIARATVKYVLAEVASRAAAKGCDQIGGFGAIACKALARGAAHGIAAASEVADTRCWGTLPAEIRMARLKLPVGKHTVSVNFKDAAGNVVGTHVFNDVDIAKGKRTYLSYRTADAVEPGQPAAGSQAAKSGVKR
ncbi:MAG: hypothetical protein NTY77_03475 [Elusimicrobia bacterium]|nr:hypothetical protein [Elusimicrobiota bacterium]